MKISLKVLLIASLSPLNFYFLVEQTSQVLTSQSVTKSLVTLKVIKIYVFITALNLVVLTAVETG